MPSSVPRLYLDANVPIAYLANEPTRAAVVAGLFDDARNGDVELLTSVLSVTEVAFIATGHSSHDSNADEDEISALWTPASPIGLTDVSFRIAERARSIIRTARSSGKQVVKPADAIHLASAEVNECDHFFTYERESTRSQWDGLIEPSVAEPFTQKPQLDLG